MDKLLVSPLDLASRFLGIHEVSGSETNPLILGFLKLDDPWPTDDDIPWCSAFVNFIAFLLGLPRSKSLKARSWLSVGTSIPLEEAEPGFDIVILSRGPDPQPGPEDQSAPGHVGFFTELIPPYIRVLGGNQSDSVTIGAFRMESVLDVRRISNVQKLNKEGAGA